MMQPFLLLTALVLTKIQTIHSFTLLNAGTTSTSSKQTTVLPRSVLLPQLPQTLIQTKNRIDPLYMSESESNDGEDQANDDRIDVSSDPRLYRILLPRATGIEWGTDLSFSFVYVRDMEPGAPAFNSNLIDVGDQICEFRAYGDDEAQVIPLIGASFDNVMTSFAALKRTVKEVELVFFKGSKEELIDLCEGGDSSKDKDEDVITITAILNKGTKEESTKIIKAEKGANLRQLLVDNEINVYQSFTRWTNCKGKQLCGTCIVNIKEGGMNTNRKSMDEGSTLRENPDSYRLSCVTFAYGDLTVETFPPIEAAQWTR